MKRVLCSPPKTSRHAQLSLMNNFFLHCSSHVMGAGSFALLCWQPPGCEIRGTNNQKCSTPGKGQRAHFSQSVKMRTELLDISLNGDKLQKRHANGATCATYSGNKHPPYCNCMRLKKFIIIIVLLLTGHGAQLAECSPSIHEARGSDSSSR